MKEVRFIGDSKKRLLEFPKDARSAAGFELRKVQNGLEPSDSKMLAGMPTGIQELRLWQQGGTFRVVFIARFAEAIYVLHAFQKKTAATTKRDLDLVRLRYEEVRASVQR